MGSSFRPALVGMGHSACFGMSMVREDMMTVPVREALQASLPRMIDELQGVLRLGIPSEWESVRIPVRSLRVDEELKRRMSVISPRWTNVVYVVRTTPILSSAVLHEHYTRWAEGAGKAIHGSRVNKENTKRNRDGVLYVGSCRSKARQRIRQHIGTRNRRTYALHLREWIDDLPRFVDFAYTALEDQVTSLQLQAIEDSLWDYYHPLFGKRGIH